MEPSITRLLQVIKIDPILCLEFLFCSLFSVHVFQCQFPESGGIAGQYFLVDYFILYTCLSDIVLIFQEEITF